MRIGIDMLGAQSAGRTRGVGRYTRSLVRELLSRHPQTEFVLYYYADAPQDDQSWPGLPTVRRLPFDAGPDLAGRARRLAEENPDELDVLLLSCPLENFRGYLPPAPPASRLRMAAIVYDLIPAVFPEQYLRHPAIAQAYWQALAALEGYDLLLTISEAGRRDCIRWLRAAPERIANISAAGDPKRFFPAAAAASPGSEVRLLERHGIREPFIYSLTALDHRKNLQGALAAYALLPAWLRSSYQLALTCAMSSDDDRAQVRKAIAASPVADRVVLTGSLDDDELRALYQRCSAFLFPSRYEGFGLPILEAMQCGAAVAAGRKSSQIEVVGDAGLLVDADRPEDIAASLRQLLTDADLARRLRSAAPQQAQRFSWQRTAELCHAALEQAVAAPPAAGRWGRLLARGRLAVKRRLLRYGPLRASA
ncbi:MAG TPA: glycosyltransferase family 1 protein [Pirellulales bacterium]|nr:glycosyltransferase family 1 protein [Pirellulales bacterium]